MKALMLLNGSVHNDQQRTDLENHCAAVALELTVVTDPADLLTRAQTTPVPELLFVDWSIPTAPALVHALRSESLARESVVVALLMAFTTEEKVPSAELDDVLRIYEIDERIRTRLELIIKMALSKQAALDVSLVQERYANYLERRMDENVHQLIHADRLATLGTMAAGVAHEVRTPLTSLLASEEIAREAMQKLMALVLPELSPDTQAKTQHYGKTIEDCLARIGRGGVRINAIVEGLRLFSKGQVHNNRSRCKVSDIIASALQVAQSRTKNQVEIHVDDVSMLSEIEIDPLQLEQVFVNLIVNAAEALHAVRGGRIVIRGTEEPATVIVVIEDNGPGLPEQLLKGEVRQFFTTKGEGGTGLGLFISRNIIQSHGGEFLYHNNPSGGAYFEIRLLKEAHRGAEPTESSENKN